MTRHRGDIPPNPGARQRRTALVALARTALLQAVQAGIRPETFLIADETRAGLARIMGATGESIDVIIARLVAAEAERVAAQPPEETP